MTTTPSPEKHLPYEKWPTCLREALHCVPVSTPYYREWAIDTIQIAADMIAGLIPLPDHLKRKPEPTSAGQHSPPRCCDKCGKVFVPGALCSACVATEEILNDPELMKLHTAGLADVQAGRLHDHEDVKKEFAEPPTAPPPWSHYPGPGAEPVKRVRVAICLWNDHVTSASAEGTPGFDRVPDETETRYVVTLPPEPEAAPAKGPDADWPKYYQHKTKFENPWYTQFDNETSIGVCVYADGRREIANVWTPTLREWATANGSWRRITAAEAAALLRPKAEAEPEVIGDMATAMERMKATEPMCQRCGHSKANHLGGAYLCQGRVGGGMRCWCMTYTPAAESPHQQADPDLREWARAIHDYFFGEWPPSYGKARHAADELWMRFGKGDQP